MAGPESHAWVSLFAITPGTGDLEGLVARLPALLEGGVDRLLVRELEAPAERRRAMAEIAVAAARGHSLEVWIARDVELAIAVGAAGVHLNEGAPIEDARRAREAGLGVGRSVHGDVLLRRSFEADGLAHLFLGPVFETKSHPGAPALGLEAFARSAAATKLPVYALGGIEVEDAESLARAGVRRVAGIGLFFRGPDPAERLRRFRRRLAARPALLQEEPSP